jgi:heavy metal translocating P-type ATPase
LLPGAQREVRDTCDFCGLDFGGPGYSPDGKIRYCCFGCYLVSRITRSSGDEGIAAWIIFRLGIGAFLAMNVMMISLVLYTSGPGALSETTVRTLRWALVILSTPAVVILAGPFVACGLRDLLRFHLGTDVLISTGSLAAYGVSVAHVLAGAGAVYFDTATMLLLIVTLGRLLEAAAKNRTSCAIREMMALTPDTARVLRDGREIEIPAEELAEGDLAVVKPGERIPADGAVVSGSAFVEEAAFTGESGPRSCSPGTQIYGGSINLDGCMTVRVEAVGSASLASRIQRMVAQARSQRVPIERLAERVAAVFVPLVWLAAAGAAAYWGIARHDPAQAGMSALAVLVVACPCALGLATPMAASLAIGRAAREGVLIRSGEVLERLPRIRRILFDKTGTLTRNRLRVAEVHGISPEEILKWAAPLEAASGHLIGAAIAREAQAAGIDVGTASDVKIVPGFGVEGNVTVDGKTKWVTVGSIDLLLKTHTVPDSLASDVNDSQLTSTCVGWDSVLQGVVLVSDETRPEAASTVSALKAMGLRTGIVSGDREGPTQRLANELGIDEVHAGCTPEYKAAIAAKARGAGFAMVGDGINDAPALAQADVGIAIGSGTDLARESSDVTLLGDDLSRIPGILTLARATYRIIRWNLAWAFGYNAVAVGLACMGLVHPLIAAVAMLASSLCVICNSLRITRLSL